MRAPNVDHVTEARAAAGRLATLIDGELGQLEPEGQKSAVSFFYDQIAARFARYTSGRAPELGGLAELRGEPAAEPAALEVVERKPPEGVIPDPDLVRWIDRKVTLFLDENLSAHEALQVVRGQLRRLEGLNGRGINASGLEMVEKKPAGREEAELRGGLASVDRKPPGRAEGEAGQKVRESRTRRNQGLLALMQGEGLAESRAAEPAARKRKPPAPESVREAFERLRRLRRS